MDKGLASKELEWNDLFGTVVDDVLCGLWQDNAQVLVMSTIHDLQTGTPRLRRRPRENQLRSKITRTVFGDEVRLSSPFKLNCNHTNKQLLVGTNAAYYSRSH